MTSVSITPPEQTKIQRAAGRKGLLLFPGALTLYFLVGRVNFINYRGVVGDNVLWALLLALLGIAFGYFLGFAPRIRRTKWRNYSTSAQLQPPGLRAFIFWFSVIGVFALLLTIYTFRGIPILHSGDARLGQSAKIAALVYCAVIALAALAVEHVERQGGRKRFKYIAIATASMLLLAYRTVPLIIITTWMLAAWFRGTLKLRISTLGLVAIIVAASAYVAVARFGHVAQGGFFGPLEQLGMPSWFRPFAPIWIVPREGVSVFSKLLQTVPSSIPETHGHVLLSSFQISVGGTHHTQFS